MTTISQVSASVIASSAPVLLVDTCGLLDVIRAVQRQRSHNIAQARLVLQGASTAPPRCVIAAASIVPKEFSDNADPETDGFVRKLREMEETSGHFRIGCDQFGLPSHSFPYGKSDLPQRLRELADSLLARSLILDDDQDCYRRAIQRVIAREPPSTKGQVKDCILLEEYLELSRQLRAAGFSLPIVLLSSNTDDFGLGSAGSAAHPKLAAEFAPLGISFTCTWGHAARELGFYP